MIVVSNRVQVPDDHVDTFLDRLREGHGIEDQPGFGGMKVLRPVDAEGMVTLTFWDSMEDYEAWRSGDAYDRAHDDRSAEDVFEVPNVVEIHEVAIERLPAGPVVEPRPGNVVPTGLGGGTNGPAGEPGGMPETSSLEVLEETPHAEVFDERQPRTVRLELDADQRIPRHTHRGKDVVLHLLSGHLELTLDDETYELRPDDLVRFSGEREVSPYAVEASTAVVVFAPAVDE